MDWYLAPLEVHRAEVLLHFEGEIQSGSHRKGKRSSAPSSLEDRGFFRLCSCLRRLQSASDSQIAIVFSMMNEP